MFVSSCATARQNKRSPQYKDSRTALRNILQSDLDGKIDLGQLLSPGTGALRFVGSSVALQISSKEHYLLSCCYHAAARQAML